MTSGCVGQVGSEMYIVFGVYGRLWQIKSNPMCRAPVPDNVWRVAILFSLMAGESFPKIICWAAWQKGRYPS